MRPTLSLVLMATVTLATTVHASIVQVDVQGTVDFNVFRDGPFMGVPSGAPASITFTLDSDVLTDSPNFPTRGYTIDHSSFVFAAGGASVGLADPFPMGQTPFFVIRNNDPAVDGFLISTNVDNPFGVPISIPGATLGYLSTFQDGSVLPSLDILDAVGSYSLAQMSVFDWSINIGPGMPMGMILDTITITVVPAPATSVVLLGACGMFARRRRR